MITFKHEVDRLLFPYLVPALIRTIGEMCCWAHEKGMPFVITETLSNEKRDLKRNIFRKSLTHYQGRAADLSLHGWDKDIILDFVDWFNIRLESIASLTHGGQKIIAVYGSPNHLDHIHIQVNSRYRITPDKKTLAEINKLLAI